MRKSLPRGLKSKRQCAIQKGDLRSPFLWPIENFTFVYTFETHLNILIGNNELIDTNGIDQYWSLL